MGPPQYGHFDHINRMLTLTVITLDGANWGGVFKVWHLLKCVENCRIVGLAKFGWKTNFNFERREIKLTLKCLKKFLNNN